MFTCTVAAPKIAAICTLDVVVSEGAPRLLSLPGGAWRLFCLSEDI